MEKILIFDIETFPNTIRSWGIYKQHALEVLEHGVMCGFSAKWLNGKQITDSISLDKKYKPGYRDDTRIIRHLWELLNEADIVVAHFGDGFDLPYVRACFARIGLNPPAPFKSVDTKKECARIFHFGGAYTLDHCCSYFGLERKLPTGGYDLWRDCMNGDPIAWKHMMKYNAHDVQVLEQLYLKILPWIAHPAVAWEAEKCPRCGSDHIQSRGVAKSKTHWYKRYQCVACGGWISGTKSQGHINLKNIA